MINFLSSWVKNLSLALIVVSILEMILPNNKTKKYVKVIMGLYILFSIIQPFVENSESLNLDNFNLEEYIQLETEQVSTNSEVDQTSMDLRLNQMYMEQLEEDITEKLKEKSYELDTCDVKAHISQEDSGIEKITIRVYRKLTDNKQEESTIEDKLVNEIQKIDKVDVSVGNKENDGETQETSKITKTDIKIIKDFLINEYGVREECLRIS